MLRDEMTNFFGLPLWLLAFGFVGGALWGTGMSLEQVLIISAFIGAPWSISVGGTFLTLYMTSVVLVYIMFYIAARIITSFVPHAAK